MSTDKTPIVSCLSLPTFQEDDLRSVHMAFSHSQPIPLNQHWLPQREPDFRPSVVRTGWRGEDLFVFAELEDADILSAATGPNQRMWELGDAFEIFLRAEDQVPYIELHVTPPNHRLQLRFASAQAFRTMGFEHHVVAVEMFSSRTWLHPDKQRWNLLARIPHLAVNGARDPLQGKRWRFSFSRYDYTRGRPEPVLSSTSPHPTPDFHRQEDWGLLMFQ